MSVSQLDVIALLRADLATEAAAGFPRLKRVPYTDIIWFLDYFAGLDSAEQQSLLHALSRWGAMAFFPHTSGPREIREVEEQCPPFARLRASYKRPGAKGGTRYTAVKMLNMDRSLREEGSYHESWRAACSPLAFQPREDLLPDLSCLKTAKAPLLRKLMDVALARLFTLEKQKRAGGACRYVGTFGSSTLTVWVDFGARLAQISYGVSLSNPDFELPVISLSYERLWDANLGWDYLTEENAARSIEFFAEQVAYLVKLGERVNGLTNGCS